MFPQPIHGLTNAELAERARELLPRGHGVARRIHRRVMLEGRFDPESWGLGPKACEEWRLRFSFELPEIVTVKSDEIEQGATTKMVLRLHDGLEVESVCIPMGRGRYTLCVSSQVGCKMGCTFCETGRMGWPIRNVVFMGMGEALDNADNVFHALRVLNDEAGLAIGQERLTVCTVGHVEGVRMLEREGLKRLNLSVSLNATRDSLRSELNRRTSIRFS